MRNRDPSRIAARAVLALSAGALLGTGPVAAQERVELRREMPPGAYVKIWSGTGTVEVEGWDRDSLVVTGARTSEIGRFFQSVGDSVGKLGLFADAGREAQVAGDLHVRVPASSTVWIKVAAAAVDVRGVSGGLDVFSVSGSVTVQGSPRSVYVESMAGGVTVDLDSAGVVRVKGGRGDVAVRGPARDLSVSAVTGSIDVESPAVQRAELESVDGGISYRGGLGRGAWLSVETHAGDIELVFPPDLSAALDLATVEGEIRNHLAAGSPPDPSFPGSRTVFESGTGEAEVEARSFAGTIRVRTAGAPAGREP